MAKVRIVGRNVTWLHTANNRIEAFTLKVMLLCTPINSRLHSSEFRSVTSTDYSSSGILQVSHRCVQLHGLYTTLATLTSSWDAMAVSGSAKIVYWAYATNVILQLVDVVAWLHPPLLCPQAQEPVAQMFVRSQSVLLAPLLWVFWMFRDVPLQGDGSEAMRVLTRLARGVACSFVMFHGATIVWCAWSVYGLRTPMTKTHLIFCFHGFYTVVMVYAYALSVVELKRI